jgi:RNA polymerase sigma factor (TIGR02999 family)
MKQGDPHAADQLLPIVYEELRSLAAARLAMETPGHTLQATALVHEAYLRLLSPDGSSHFDDRGHCFAAAAEAMRRLLVERARRHRSQKHGGQWNQVELSDVDAVTVGTPHQIVGLDEALAMFAAEEPQAAELANLVVFAGFQVAEAGRLLEMSRATAYRHWSYARAWIKTQLAEGESRAN